MVRHQKKKIVAKKRQGTIPGVESNETGENVHVYDNENILAIDLSKKPVRWLLVRFRDGNCLKVPAYDIARNLVEHISKQSDSINKMDMLQRTVRCPEALINWASNNIKWYDIKDKAILDSRQSLSDRDLEWGKAPKEAYYGE